MNRLWRGLTRPPYAAIPWAVFFYALICCLIYTANGPLAGHILGFDDNVRMTQVLQWVDGGGWYNRVITRVNAPDGFQTIWARLVDIPLALVVILAQPFTGQKTAAFAASLIVPMMQLAIMFWTARYFARPIAGKQEAWLAILFLMFTTVLNHKQHTMAGFHPGEVGHHAWYGILNVLMFGAAIRVVLGVAGHTPKLMLALAIGLLLAVGIEGLPMIAGTVATLSILSFAFDNHRLAWRSASSLGIAAAISLLLLPVQLPPSQWFEVSFAQPSILGPTLAALAASYLAVQTLLLKKIKSRTQAGFALGVLVIIIARLLIVEFPQILSGATAGLSSGERSLTLTEHHEIWSMHAEANSALDYFNLVMPSLIAIAAGLMAIFTTGVKRRRMMFAAYTFFALIPGGLAQIYWRYIHHAETAACPLLLYAWQRVRKSLPAKNCLMAAATFLLAGPLWMWLLPALEDNEPVLSNVVLYPAKLYAEDFPCDIRSFADYLNKHYPPETLIDVPDWDSATFLFNTDLRIDFLANYPSQDHFIDNKFFFWIESLDIPKNIAARHKFDLVATCTMIPMAPDVAASRPERAPMFIERLREGLQPAWLKPVPTGLKTNYLLFEVDKAALSDKGK